MGNHHGREILVWNRAKCKKDGSYYWESATISPVLDETGEIIRYVAVKEDITERRQAEVALRESEEKFR